jgi:hypothetical protein
LCPRQKAVLAAALRENWWPALSAAYLVSNIFQTV